MTAHVCPVCGTRTPTDGCPACEAGTVWKYLMVDPRAVDEAAIRADERAKVELEVRAYALKRGEQKCGEGLVEYASALSDLALAVKRGRYRAEPAEAPDRTPTIEVG